MFSRTVILRSSLFPSLSYFSLLHLPRVYPVTHFSSFANSPALSFVSVSFLFNQALHYGTFWLLLSCPLSTIFSLSFCFFSYSCFHSLSNSSLSFLCCLSFPFSLTHSSFTVPSGFSFHLLYRPYTSLSSVLILVFILSLILLSLSFAVSVSPLINTLLLYGTFWLLYSRPLSSIFSFASFSHSCISSFANSSLSSAVSVFPSL